MVIFKAKVNWFWMGTQNRFYCLTWLCNLCTLQKNFAIVMQVHRTNLMTVILYLQKQPNIII